MFIALGVLLIIIGIILVWFNIPYSPVKQQFSNDLAGLKAESSSYAGEVFTENDFRDMPLIIRIGLFAPGHEKDAGLGGQKLHRHYNDRDHKAV